jgi:glycosyltransferase involved in cell wall biosynthesis
MNKTARKDLSDLSILVSYFNKENFLNPLFDCLIDCLELNAKIHIIDDGSNEKSRNALREKVGRISPKLKRNLSCTHQTNIGSSGTRNLLLGKVNTPFFIFLDADDKVIPRILKDCLNWLKCSTADCLIAPWSEGEKTFPFPEEKEKPRLFLMQRRDEIYRAMGYWRIIYRKNSFDNSIIRFLPGVRESKFKDFILDDALFLIRFSSKVLELLLASRDSCFYIYSPPPFSQEARANYRRQESIMPLAVIYYVNFYARHGQEISNVEEEMLWENLLACYRDLTPKSKRKFFLRFVRSSLKISRPIRVRKNCMKFCSRLMVLLMIFLQAM